MDQSAGWLEHADQNCWVIDKLVLFAENISLVNTNKQKYKKAPPYENLLNIRLDMEQFSTVHNYVKLFFVFLFLFLAQAPYPLVCSVFS